jgi:hypothetical protein
MKYYLIAAASLLLASCTRPPVTTPPHSEPIGADALPPNDTRAQLPPGDTEFINPLDSVVVSRPPSRLDKLLGRTPKAWKVPLTVAHQPVSLGKKSTVNVYYGAVTNAGKKAQVAAGDGAAVVVAAKKAGPVVLADSGAKVNVASSKKGPAQAGEGNVATAPAPGFPWWVLAIPVVVYVGYRKFIAI